METEKPGQMNDVEKMAKPAQKTNPMTKAIIVPDLLLVVQFLLGMFNNFYVNFPEHAAPLDNWKFVLHSISEQAHIFLGIIMLLAVINTLVGAIRMKNTHMIRTAMIGLTGVLLAVIGGVLFVTTQIDLFSYLMSIGFLIAVLAVNIGFLTNVVPQQS
jgi:hypothetical protein